MVARLLALFCLIFILFEGFGQEDGDIVQKGQQAPDFVFNIENGQIIKLSDCKGKVVFINFFATWCGPCKVEMPFLQEKVWLKYKNNDNFKLLSFGRGHSVEEVTLFKIENKFDFPIYPDKDKGIYNKFATMYIPRNYIVDKSGKVVYMSVGFSNDEFGKMIDFLDNLLK